MKTFTGRVLSTKMDKTIVVEVTRQWAHPVYKKTVKRTKKYKVHDGDNRANLGDTVSFVETRPFAKTVHYRVHEIISAAAKPSPSEKKTAITTKKSTGKQK